MSTTAIVGVVLCAALLPARVDVRPKAKTGSILHLTATAYCHDGKSQSGIRTRDGIVAADPRVLPLGSVVRIEMRSRPFSRVYTVMDTGGAVKGHTIDIFMPICAKARRFGRQRVRAQVLRLGWDSNASTE